MSGSSVIWAKQRELGKHFLCVLLNTSYSNSAMRGNTLSTGGG